MCKVMDLAQRHEVDMEMQPKMRKFVPTERGGGLHYGISTRLEKSGPRYRGHLEVWCYGYVGLAWRPCCSMAGKTELNG